MDGKFCLINFPHEELVAAVKYGLVRGIVVDDKEYPSYRE